MLLKIKKMRDTAILPEYGTYGAAGLDFFASLDGIEQGMDEYIVMPGELVKIPLGIAVELEPGYEIQLRGRSGLTMRGIVVHIGTGDEDYRGELHAMVHNMSTRAFVMENGTKICQGIINRVENASTGITIELVDELSETLRGENGFGHTGI